MVAIKNIILLAAAATASVLPRDAATIKADLATINADTTNLTTQTNNYSGKGNGLVAVVQAEQKLENDLDASAGRAQKSAAVSSTDATAIINYINQTLEPNVKKAVTAINNKKAQFTADGVQSVVLSDLKSVKNRTDTFAAALIKLTPTAQQSAAKSAQATIDNDLQAGINNYS